MVDKTLHEHLVEIQSEVKIPKANYNEFGGYYSRSAEDIIEAVKPLLRERGLTLLTPCEAIELGDGVYQKCVATISDGKAGIEASAYAKEHPEKKKMDNSQLSGGAMSYAKKYALGNLFAIDDTKDADQLKPEDEKPKAKPVTAKDVEQQFKSSKAKDEESPVVSKQAIDIFLKDIKSLSEEDRAAFKIWLKEEGLTFGKGSEGWNLRDSDLERVAIKISEFIEPIE